MNGLWKYNGEVVAVLKGVVTVERPDGAVIDVPVEELAPADGLRDMGKSEGDQFVKLIIETDPDGKCRSLGVEVNGIWPGDVAKFLRLGLDVVEGRTGRAQ